MNVFLIIESSQDETLDERCEVLEVAATKDIAEKRLALYQAGQEEAVKLWQSYKDFAAALPGVIDQMDPDYIEKRLSKIEEFWKDRKKTFAEGLDVGRKARLRFFIREMPLVEAPEATPLEKKLA